MFSEFTIISIAITAVAIEADKITQFTHPTLHAISLGGMLLVVYSLAIAA